MMGISKILLGAAIVGCAVQGAGSFAWADGAGKFAGLDMASGKIGTVSELLPMSQFCGTKKIKV
ncbi:MAG TPA: hypothetical protein VHE81_10670, partial [Lacipirellulaceae bacterium]|nr:hypothetical protein [Lacipirellulaceae bacterium]